MEITKTSAAYNKLLEAAKMIVCRFTDPGKFLEKCTDYSHYLGLWYRSREKLTNDQDHSYTLTVLTQQIVPLLYASKKDMDAMVWGLKEVVDFSGPDGFRQLVNNLVVAFGHHTEDGDWVTESLKEHLEFFTMLTDLTLFYEEYESLLDKADHVDHKQAA